MTNRNLILGMILGKLGTVLGKGVSFRESQRVKVLVDAVDCYLYQLLSALKG